jgi:hypothetical protein
MFETTNQLDDMLEKARPCDSMRLPAITAKDSD